MWEFVTDSKQSDPTVFLAEEGEKSNAAIVQNLKDGAKDEVEWKARLADLQEKGFEPEIVFLDVGLVTELNDANRRNFLDLFTAIAHFDGYRAGQLMVE